MTELFVPATNEDKINGIQLYSYDIKRSDSFTDPDTEYYVPIIGEPDVGVKLYKKVYIKEYPQITYKVGPTPKYDNSKKKNGGKKRKTMRSKRLKRVKRRTYKNK